MIKHHSGLFLASLAIALTLTACGGNGTDPLASFREQTLSWHVCGTEVLGEPYAPIIADIGSRVQCADMSVPLDYSAPAKGSAKVALVRVAADDGNASAPAIMFSPGGPGLSDPGMPALIAWNWGRSDAAGGAFKTIAQTFQMIGWSPRGVGMSTNLNCKSDEQDVVYVSGSGDRSKANVDAMFEQARRYAKACQAQTGLTPYINSDATARDLDLMRQILHQEKLNFYGLSYATWLGTWYATLFPDRVGRFVLIGNVDSTGTFDRMWLNNVTALQRVLDDVLAPYAARHPARFGLGSDAGAIQRIFATLPPPLQDVTSTRMSAGLDDSGASDTALDYLRGASELRDLLAAGTTQAGIAQALQKANGLWAARAQELADAYFGFLAAKPAPIDLPPSQSVHFAIQCNDVPWHYDEASWRAVNDAQASFYSFFGGFFTAFPCTYWGGPVVQRPSLANAAGAQGFLMLQSQYDPQTPLEGALNSLAALPDAGMIVVGNAIDHVVPVPYGSDCVDLPVAQYLLSGTRPPRMTNCPGNLLPQDAANAP